MGSGAAESEAARAVSVELTTVTRRLLLVTAVMLMLTTSLFLVPILRGGDRFPMTWFCFGVGVLGGFVSIQQRLRLLSEPELTQLARHWVHVIVIPLFGGIFALLVYVLTLSGVVEGPLFPAFTIPEWGGATTTEDLRAFFLETYPASGRDFAKLIFWAFVAGFSERFLPDMIERTVGHSQA